MLRISSCVWDPPSWTTFLLMPRSMHDHLYWTDEECGRTASSLSTPECRIQCLHPLQSPVRQRVLDTLLQTRKKIQWLPHVQPTMQHWVPNSCWDPEHVYPAIAAPTPPAAACPLQGRWKDLKGPFIWWVGLQQKRTRSPPPLLQRHLPAGHEGPWHWCQQVGRACQLPQFMEADVWHHPPERWCQMAANCGWKKREGGRRTARQQPYHTWPTGSAAATETIILQWTFTVSTDIAWPTDARTKGTHPSSLELVRSQQQQPATPLDNSNAYFQMPILKSSKRFEKKKKEKKRVDGERGNKND